MGDGNRFRRRRRQAQFGKQAGGKAKRRDAVHALRGRKLGVESLEDRRMLATFTVTNLQDTFINDEDQVEARQGSLRWAVQQANETEENDVILFSNALAGTIELNNGQIGITGGVRILGPTAQKIQVQAAANSRIFEVDDDDDDVLISVEISGMWLIGGNAQGGEEEGQGGAIRSTENLRMTEVILSNNSASQGGGAIFHDFGELRIWRSLIIDNSAGGLGGGAIMIGVNEQDSEGDPSAEIRNSTLSGNAATSDGEGEGYGGAILILKGELAIEQCTITQNSAVTGGGVASFGNQPAPSEEEDPPPATVETTVIGTILWDNEGGDINDVGMTEEGEPLDPSITSEGYNIIGDTNIELAGTDLEDDPLFVTNDDGDAVLVDVGGVTPVYYLQATSPAIDAGNPELSDEEFEQRGRHFTRAFGYLDPEDPIADIGAVEIQSGTFIVDIASDESDNQYSSVTVAGDDPYIGGDFSLREAVLFSELNPEVDSIQFIGGGTISLTLGELLITQPASVDGPTTALVTISGSNFSRIFNIDDDDDEAAIDVFINNVTLQNARAAGSGAAILNRENLFLDAVTIRNNTATLRGGGVFSEFGALFINGSTINNNRASDDGGGVYVNGSVAQIVQSTISGNTASDRGAGITNNGGDVAIYYSTITNNSSASTLASGVVNFGATASTQVRSTIISGNANNDLGAFQGATVGTFESLGYNLIGNGNVTTAFNMPGDKTGILNPLLNPLAVTGGRLATHRPGVGSPAIDMGDPAAIPAEGDTPEFDQRGTPFTRVFDGDEDGVARIDIGAYELQANIIVVDNGGDDSDGNTTPGNVTLREAIELANQNPAPDTIVFDITMLGPAITILNGTLSVTDSVEILGPGSGILAVAGTDAGILLINDNQASLSDVAVTGLELRNAVAGAIVSRENLTIDDVIFLGNASSSGGALFQELGTLKLNNTLITGNSASGDGGALFLNNTTVEITGYTTIVGNNTSGTGSDGGAIAIRNSTLTASQLTIAGNSTPGGSTRGGAMFIENSSVLLEESIISGNSTTGTNSQGGGIAAVNSQVVIEKNSLITLNSTVGSQSPGGAIFMDGGSLSLGNSQVIQNSTTGLNSSGGGIALQGATASIFGSFLLENTVSGVGSNGGGIANIGGTLVVRNTSIVRNEARHANATGGGVYSDTNLSGTQTTSIVNSTVSGNSAPLRGGGVFNADGRTEILHSTITDNFSRFFNTGAGVASVGNAATLTVFGSSIIAGNRGEENGSDVDWVGGTLANSVQSLGYNVFGVGNATSSFMQAGDKRGITDPGLDILADNGGTAPTHAVLAGSPAINAGSPTFNPGDFTPPLNADQRGAGFPRVAGGRIDAGAYESAFSPLNADFDGNGRVDAGDFLVWQRNVGKTSGASKGQGDANGDGAVDASDLAAWRSQFGSTLAEVTAAPAVVSDEAAASTSVATVHFAVAPAKETAPLDAAALAGSGTPQAGSAGRPTYRPPVRRDSVAIDAVYAADDLLDPAPAVRPASDSAVALDADDAGDVADEWGDEAFALLGAAAL